MFKPILDALDPPYDPYASPPAYIFIREKQVPLVPGMTVSGGGVTICEGVPCPAGRFWRIHYVEEIAPLAYSELVFDEEYTLLTSRIQPEHQEEFQPLLDAFAAH